MPSKRSRSQEREKKRKSRLKRSNEEIKAERERALEGMKKCRERKTTFDKELRRETEKDRINKTRENNFDEIKEYNKIENKHRMRKYRRNVSTEERVLKKLKANQGMKDLRDKGRLQKYADRGQQNTDKLIDWRRYKEKNETNLKTLEKCKPDIVQQINEKVKIEKEEFRSRERRRKIEHFQFYEKYGLTEDQKNEYSALLEERHMVCMKEQKQRDKNVVLALQDDIKDRKLEDYYDREKTLTEDERKEFTKLRVELYKNFRTMNNIEKDTKKMKQKEEVNMKKIVNESKENTCNKLKQNGEKADIKENEKNRVEKICKTKNSKQRKKLTITFA